MRGLITQDEGQEKRDVRIATERTLKKKKKTVRWLDQQKDRIKRGGTADVAAETTVAEDAVGDEAVATDAVGDAAADAADADVVAVTVDAVAADTTAAAAETAANSADDTAHNAAACLIDDANVCSVVVLTVGAGDMLSTPDADGGRTEGAEALCSRSSAGDAAHAASARRQMVMPEPCRGTQPCVLQPGVGTGSAPYIPTSALKGYTHLR